MLREKLTDMLDMMMEACNIDFGTGSVSSKTSYKLYSAFYDAMTCQVGFIQTTIDEMTMMDHTTRIQWMLTFSVLLQKYKVKLNKVHRGITIAIRKNLDSEQASFAYAKLIDDWKYEFETYTDMLIKDLEKCSNK